MLLRIIQSLSHKFGIVRKEYQSYTRTFIRQPNLQTNLNDLTQ